MKLVSFESVNFTAAVQVELPREAKTAYLEPAGYMLGERDLFGVSSPLGNQRYRAEVLFIGDQRVDAYRLLSLLGQRHWLTQQIHDGSYRATLAKLIRCDVDSRLPDSAARVMRLSCEFVAEPYWYSAESTVSFANQSSVAVNHLGNVRCIRHLRVTINTSLPNGTLIIRGSGCELSFSGSTDAPLTIDVGAHSVRVGAVDAFARCTRPDTQIPLFWLNPGANNITFSRAVSGSIVFRHAYV